MKGEKVRQWKAKYKKGGKEGQKGKGKEGQKRRKGKRKAKGKITGRAIGKEMNEGQVSHIKVGQVKGGCLYKCS